MHDYFRKAILYRNRFSCETDPAIMQNWNFATLAKRKSVFAGQGKNTNEDGNAKSNASISTSTNNAI